MAVDEPSDERLQNIDENPQSTDENPQNIDENPQNTDENPQNTDENLQNTDEKPQNTDENSPYTPERQMWTVIDESMHVIFKYFDYNTLLTRGVRCKNLVFDGITSIIERAHNEAAKCSSAEDPNKCFDDVSVRIGLRYGSGRVPIRTCINRAGMTITDEGIEAILETFIKNTSWVVISEFKKGDQTLAATKEEGIPEEINDNAETEESNQRDSIVSTSDEVQQGDRDREGAQGVPLNDAQSQSIKPTSDDAQSQSIKQSDNPKSVEAPPRVILALKETKAEEASPTIIEEAKTAKVVVNPIAMQMPVLSVVNTKPNGSNPNIAMEFKRTVTETVRVYVTPQSPEEPKPLDGAKSDHLSNDNVKPETISANATVAQPALSAIKGAIPAGARP